MKTFYINPLTGDLELDGLKNIKMASDDDEIVQSVWNICSTNLEEWFLNEEHGFDKAAIQGKKFDKNLTIETLYAAILQEERISTIDDIDVNFDNATRKLTINFSLIKADGEIINGGVTI